MINHKPYALLFLKLMLCLLFYKITQVTGKYKGKLKQKCHLEGEQNDRKVKRSKIKQKWVKKRENSKYKRPLSVKIITGPWQSGHC